MQIVRRFCTTLKPIQSEIKNLLMTHKVVLFMKGTPESPLCRFSQVAVQILDIHGVRNYEAIDVLENDQMREGIKEYSNWPTIPQLFLQGELIGGCDILLEMHKSGDLVKELNKIGIKSELHNK